MPETIAAKPVFESALHYLARRAPSPVNIEEGDILFRIAGACEIYIGNNQCITPSSDRLFSMLAVCCLSPHGVTSKAKLLNTVWPELNETDGDHTMRQHSYKLRQQGLNISSQGDSIVTDITKIIPTYSFTRLPSLFERDVVNGEEPFGQLFGNWLPNMMPMRDWVERQRDRFISDIRGVLTAELHKLKSVANWVECDIWARALLELDAYNEDATIILAEAACMLGNRIAANNILEAYIADNEGYDHEFFRNINEAIKRIKRSERISYDRTKTNSLIGREDILTETDKLLIDRTSAYIQHIDINGSTGIGKTEIAYEILRRAVIHGYSKCAIRISESYKDVDLGMIVRLIQDLLNLPGAMGCDPKSMSNLRRIADISVSSHENHHIPYTESIGDLITAIGEEKPLIVLIDDIDNSDKYSLQEFQRLLDSSTKANAIFLTTSSNNINIEESSIKKRAYKTHIALGYLSFHAAVELAMQQKCDHGRNIDPYIAIEIAKTTQRSPYEIITLARKNSIEGIISSKEQGIYHTIRRTIFNLSSETLTILQSLAILGGAARTSRIVHALDIGYTKKVKSVKELLKSSLAEDNGDGVITCSSDVSNLVISMMDASESFLLRHRLATHMLEELDRVFDIDTAIITAHLIEECADESLLIRFCICHAISLAEYGFVAKTSRLLEDALAAAPDPRYEKDILEILTQVANRASNWNVVLDSILSLNKLDINSREDMLEIRLSELEASTRTDLHAKGRSNALEAIRLAQYPNSTIESKTRALRLSMIAASDLFDPKLAKRAFVQLLNILPSKPNYRHPAIEPYMQYHTVFGDINKAVEAAYETYELFDPNSMSPYNARTFCNAAFVLRFSGHIVDAKDWFNRAYTCRAFFDNPARRAYAAWQLSLIACDENDSDDAIEWHQKLTETISNDSNMLNQHWYQLHQLRIESIKTGNIANPFSILARIESECTRPSRALLYAVALSLKSEATRIQKSKFNELLNRGISFLERYSKYGGQDVLANATIDCLSIKREDYKAQKLLREYILKDRRSSMNYAAIFSNLGAQFKHTIEESLKNRDSNKLHCSSRSRSTSPSYTF